VRGRDYCVVSHVTNLSGPHKLSFAVQMVISKLVALHVAEHDTASKWEALWKSSSRSRKMARFDDSPPSCRILKMYKPLPRLSCSLLTQLRTGHVGLNSFLHKINATDSPLSQACGEREDVDQYLLRCKRFTSARHRLRMSLECGTRLTIKTLLGNLDYTKKLLKYAHDSGRFASYIDYVDHDGDIWARRKV